MTDNGWITWVLKSRFLLTWGSHRAPLLSTPAFRTPASPVMTAALEQEISSLLNKQAFEEVSHLPSLGFYGRIFVVPKASGGWKPVWDLPALNLYLHRIHFRMETTSSIRDAIQQGDWATSLDMTEAFFQPSQRFHKLELYTDASNFGWSGHADTECLREMASSPVELAHQQTQGQGCGSLSGSSSEAKQSALSRTTLQ